MDNRLLFSNCFSNYVLGFSSCWNMGNFLLFYSFILAVTKGPMASMTECVLFILRTWNIRNRLARVLARVAIARAQSTKVNCTVRHREAQTVRLIDLRCSDAAILRVHTHMQGRWWEHFNTSNFGCTPDSNATPPSLSKHPNTSLG